MDHAGAVLGPLFATVALLWWQVDLRTVFWLAGVPGAICVLVLVFGVREADPSDLPAAPANDQGARAAAPDPPVTDGGPNGGLAPLLVPLGLFTLGNASDVFLLLKAGESRASLTTLPLLWVALHVVKSSTSVVGGQLADRFGRRRLIGIGWVIYALIYAGFAYAETPVAVWTLFIVYGVYFGLTEGAEKALVAELAPRAKWGAAFGLYHLTMGLLALGASVLFGALWDAYGSAAAFLTSSALALAAVACLALMSPRAATGGAAG
jgi:MFS family permease